jgi:hypothetical protein
VRQVPVAILTTDIVSGMVTIVEDRLVRKAA